MLFAGFDERGPQLYHLDPSGTYILCDAKAIGSASEGAQTSLQGEYHKVSHRNISGLANICRNSLLADQVPAARVSDVLSITEGIQCILYMSKFKRP